RRDGRSLDLFSEARADTVRAPSTALGGSWLANFREFGIGAQILRDVGVGKIRWLEPPLAPRQPARLRARDPRVRAAHARRPGSQLRDAARPEAVQGPLRSGAMRRVGVTAVLVGLAALVSAAPLPEDVVRAK